jgi:hypothetical protein
VLKVTVDGRVISSIARLILKIDIGKLLAVVVADNKDRANVLDGPGRREAAAHRLQRINTLISIKHRVVGADSLFGVRATEVHASGK